MALVLYDTLRREKVPFEPRAEGRVSIYVCGPTVQADAHVGHGRAAVVFDVLRRHLDSTGHEVDFVTNVTDINDKIMIRARREKTTSAVIATRYTLAWNRTMDALGILPPDVQPLATSHVLHMTELIQELIDQDKAYERDGNVLFRVRSFPEYGRLSNRRIDDMQAGGDDLVGRDLKDDPLDFAMWKAAKPDEPSWPSPWGRGRPGWHIECAAMAVEHLGAGFDIHGGGYDLVFPHHENEIAQHEAAHGTTFARHWMHNGMVQMGEDKMSKSIGNVVALEEAVGNWGQGPLRLWYLSAHHRSPLTYDSERLTDASAVHRRFVTFLRSARRAAGDIAADAAAAESHRDAFRAAMDDDLNAPQAVAALHELITDGNERLTKAEAGHDDARAAVAGLADTLVEIGDGVLGLALEAALTEAAERERQLAPLVQQLLAQRSAARADKDFAAADAIRDQLTSAGVVVEDRPDGARWYVDEA